MCGILGIVSREPIRDRNWLSVGRDAMHHRGPDDAGLWWSDNGCVGLAHRRLSVIDLSPAGHQPMRNVRGELIIVFNGEIYNFRELRNVLEDKGHSFQSSTDTEVVMAAYREWGAECLSRLNGMFAFALYDIEKGELFLARDRAGEKPLFYYVTGNTIAFASELKALFADPALSRKIEPEALECYLTFGFVPGERCIIRGLKKLPPAHAMIFHPESSGLKIWRYWKMPEFDGNESSDNPEKEDDLLDELEDLFEDAVQRQLLADVPVGILLSGGVDSSLVTAMAVRKTAKVKTFTVRFPGYSAYDETQHARLIASHFQTEHLELNAGEIKVDLLPLLARQFDEPIIDSSMIPMYLVSRLVLEHCTVALGGDGGDELFGGYGHYSRLQWMDEKLGWLPQSLRLMISKSAEFLLPVGFKGRNWLQGLGVDLKGGVPLIASYFDRNTRRRLMTGNSSGLPAAELIREGRIPRAGDLVQRSTRMDFENYLPEDILVKVDRAGMLNSLENRAPFLDYRVIEFAFKKVPSRLKATAHSRKILLKKLAGRLLPAEFDSRRKQGFSIPLDAWLKKGTWRQFFYETLLESENPLFDRRSVKGLLDGQDKGRANSERLFALVMFELWRREYKISL
jgi:asparagine synthase (glutamine-hydrolysing)